MIFWCLDQDVFCATWYDNCDAKNQEYRRKLLPVVGTNGKPRENSIIFFKTYFESQLLCLQLY